MAESSNDAALAPLRRFLADPRVRIRLSDARNALLHEPTLYDLIEADPLRPSMAGSGNLYSVEFYRLLRSRLKPGGLATVWAPTERAHRTFRAAFEHVVQLPDNILVGSPTPIPLRHRRWRRQVEEEAVTAYLDLPGLVSKAREALGAAGSLPPLENPGRLNLDLFPRDEFRSPER
jgi:spermidine synthase